MSINATAGMVVEAWNDLDRATAQLSSQDAEQRVGTASPISWSVAHVTTQVDSWLNAVFQGRSKHPFISQERFRFGAAGEPASWAQVLSAVAEVRESARPYLDSLTASELDRRFPYEGSLLPLREKGITVRYALTRMALHHYFHIGEIAAVRASLGHQIGDFPGQLEACL